MENAVLFRVKRGYLDEWKKWCKEIREERYQEAKETLAEENLSQEGVFLFEYNNEHFVLGFTDGDGLPPNPDREINKTHKQKKETCLEYIGHVDILYHIK